MTDASEQTANFTVLSFGHHDFDPGAVLLLLQWFHTVNAEFPFREEQTLSQLLVDFRARNTCHLCFIGAEDSIAWVSEFLGQIAVIRHQNQTGGVFIQATDSKQPRTLFREQIEDESTPFRIIGGTKIPRWLVQHEVFLPLNP